MVVLIFLAAFATLAISFWPCMIPFVLTIDEAAAPQSRFMFWGEGLFVFALMLLYTIISCSVFRGKVASTPERYETAQVRRTREADCAGPIEQWRQHRHDHGNTHQAFFRHSDRLLSSRMPNSAPPQVRRVGRKLGFTDHSQGAAA